MKCFIATVTAAAIAAANLPFISATVFRQESKIEAGDGDDRHLQIVEGVLAAFSIASAVTPVITDIINGNKKECQQLACWISTPSRTCAIAAAAEVQSEITKGRDNWGYESIGDTGMWVRYWRTKFEPVDRGDIASGNCTDGSTFVVTNCQSTGRVRC